MGRYFRCFGGEIAKAMKLVVYCRPVSDEAFFLSANRWKLLKNAKIQEALLSRERMIIRKNTALTTLSGVKALSGGQRQILVDPC